MPRYWGALELGVRSLTHMLAILIKKKGGFGFL